jgi:hypothetical protein
MPLFLQNKAKIPNFRVPKNTLFKALGAINNTYPFGWRPDALLTGCLSAH